MNNLQKTQNIDIDYRAMRLIIGLIAFALPIAVWLISTKTLTSISASYHTNAQDIFVGTLFVVGAYFIVYNGHNLLQASISKIAGIASILTALYPTACDECSIDLVAKIHYASAGTLFFILSIFCLFFFRNSVNEKIRNSDPKNSGYEVARLSLIHI